MTPGLRSFLPLFRRPKPSSRHWNPPRLLFWLLGLAWPLSTAAAKSSSAAHNAPAAAGPAITASPSLPTGGRLSDSEVAALNTQSRLNRLGDPSAQTYDIVPPAHPQTPPGPLPGYQIVRLGRGHNNRLCLVGVVAGTKGLMMLDTGASNTALSEATYRSLLLDASAKLPPGVPRSVSLNGTRTPLAEAPNFYVGKSDLGAVPVSLVPRRYLFDAGAPGSKGRLYDGLLGDNILRHYNALIDCARLVLYLDIDPGKKLNQSASFVRHGWTRVPMSDTGHHFTVPCVLNGRNFRLVVDTGAPFTNLDRNLLDAARIGSHDLPLRGGLIGTEAEQAGLVDLNQLQIGGYTATGVHMTATRESLAAFGGGQDRSAGGPIVGLLGGDILASNGAVIDMGTRALYLKHPVGKAGVRRTLPAP